MSQHVTNMPGLMARAEERPVNQCDGCRRGLGRRLGVHYDAHGHAVMGCTADRYVPDASPSSEFESDRDDQCVAN